MNQDHIFIEIETADKVVTAVSAVRTDRKGNVLRAFTDSVSTDRDLSAIIQALREALLQNFTEQYVVVGYRAAYVRELLGSGTLPRTWIDIYDLAWPFVYYDLAPSRHFEALCHTFGLPSDRDTADEGKAGWSVPRVELMTQLYWRMMVRYRVALVGEEMARGFTHEFVESVKGMFR